MHNGEYVSCSDVVPGTTAKLKCRDGYHIEKGSTSFDVRCNETGGWFPEPIQCVPGPLMINIYVNNSSVSLQTDVQNNNITFISDDKIIIYINKKENNDPDIDIRLDTENKNF